MCDASVRKLIMKLLQFFIHIFFAAILIFLSVDEIAAQAINIEKLRSEYSSTKNETSRKQAEFKTRYSKATSDRERNNIIQESQDYIFKILTERIFPAWYGTKWDFNGTSRIPGKGQIACGTFVVYTLQDAGFKIPSRMARQPAENIIKNLIPSPDIKRFSNSAPMERVLRWIREKGEGLFIVGLDIHVGLIIYKNDKITFCHSSYYNPPLSVVNQDAMERSPLTDSKYRVLGKILDGGMMKKWINGEAFPIIYNYFNN